MKVSKQSARLAAIGTILATTALGFGQVNVLTHRYNSARTGGNSNESILNTTNVNPSQFGKLMSYTVDGQVYAQPLTARYNLGGRTGVKTVVFLATAHNSVYAYDANATSSSVRPFWKINLGPSVPNSDVGSNDMSPEIGIVSTPVVDLQLQTIYVVSKTKEAGVYYNKLHAIDITTGRERRGSPVVIGGQVPGTGDGSVNGYVKFQAYYQMNRPGLLLQNGRVYIAFGSHGDMRPYHGWVFGYDARSLARTAIHCTNADGIMGGIWQSGTGLTANANGDIFYMSGNGTFDAAGTRNLGNSFVKLTPTRTGQLNVTDSFTPYDSEMMNWYDLDLGSSGPISIPGTNYILGGGKYGGLYLLDQNNMGGFNLTGNRIVQNVPAMGGHLHFAPVLYRTANDLKVYLWSEDDNLKQFTFANGRLSETPTSISEIGLPWGMPGGMLAVSSNGTTPGTGIVWAATPTDNANQQTVPGEFHAFDANDLTRMLWSTTINPERDGVGNFAKYCPPLVANGRVYLATFSNRVNVYGLLPNTPDN